MTSSWARCAERSIRLTCMWARLMASSGRPAVSRPAAAKGRPGAAGGPPPAQVRAGVAGELAHDREPRVAVGVEDAFGQADPGVTAVALHLALVGVELDAPELAGIEQRRGDAG